MDSSEAPTSRLRGPGYARLFGADSVLLAGAAVVLGLAAAGGVYAFRHWIELVHAAAYDVVGPVLSSIGPWALALLPLAGGLLVGLVITLLGEERHHGVAGIMEAVALGGGRLRWKRLPAKAVAAGLSIGVGASVGPEDPSVQIGANVGSFLGERLRLSEDRVRALVAAGAAAGIAAAFDAPIAGVFFALEILLGEIGGGALSLVLLASVCSSALTHALSGEHPAFLVPPYALRSAAELPAYLVLGAVAGLVSAAYITALYASHDLFPRTGIPRWARPAVAGLLIGLVGLALPAVLGVGYGGVESVLHGEWTGVGFLLALLAAKLVMTALCIGAGFPGGVFAPSLFLGAMLGAALGRALDLAIPGASLQPAAFALVGMGAVLAGSVHAPLTAMLLLFEMTQDYRIMVPSMLAIAASLLVSRRLRRDSVYTLGLARKGIRLERGRDVEVLEALTVGEVMQTVAPTIGEQEPLEAAVAAIERTRHLGLAVVDAQGELVGLVAAQDVDRARAEGLVAGRTVGDACTRDLLVAHPDETLAAALRRMSVRDVGRLPVVDPDAPRRLLGMLRRSDVVRAYDLAARRRTALRHQVQRARLGEAAQGATVAEYTVTAGAGCDGRRLSDVPWPRASVLATVRRGARVLLPRGDTVLKAGDVIVAVTEGEAAALEVSALCGPRAPSAPSPAPPA